MNVHSIHNILVFILCGWTLCTRAVTTNITEFKTQISAFSLQSVFVYFVRFSGQRASIYSKRINLVFVTQIHMCCALRQKIPYKMQISFRLQRGWIIYIYIYIYTYAGLSSRAVWGVSLRLLSYCDRKFESHRGHGCLSVVCVVR
jgi:hypothetical protein